MKKVEYKAYAHTGIDIKTVEIEFKLNPERSKAQAIDDMREFEREVGKRSTHKIKPAVIFRKTIIIEKLQPKLKPVGDFIKNYKQRKHFTKKDVRRGHFT